MCGWLFLAVIMRGMANHQYQPPRILPWRLLPIAKQKTDPNTVVLQEPLSTPLGISLRTFSMSNTTTS